MKKNFTLIFSFLLIALGAKAQNPTIFCGTGSEQMLKIYETSEEARNNRTELEEFTKEFIRNSDRNRLSAERIIIPMVFHIVHNDGSSNISEAQVHSAIREINKDYHKKNTDTSSTISIFKGIAANVDIEFRIARIDPSGQCTNGIVRVKNKRQNLFASDSAKIASPAWPTNKYLNVWVVTNIESGAGGYAYLPGGAPAGGDGIVIRHQQFGNGGTSQFSGDMSHGSLTHEIGHYLNLSHTWGPTNNPGLVSNCNFANGDFVDDTPKCKGAQGCNLNELACDSVSLANVQNYMDYAGCYTMFTQGQKARMIAALHSTVAGRNNLWSVNNLKATGVYDNTYYLSSCEDNFVCSGNQANFDVLPVNNNKVQVKWIFPGGTPESVTDSLIRTSPNVTYNNQGIYDVTLIVGADTATRKGAIRVGKSTAWYGMPFNDGFEYNYITDNGWTTMNNERDATSWTLSKVAGHSGSNCLKLNNYDVVYSRFNDDLISPPLDFSAANSGSFQFYTALAKKLDLADTAKLLKVDYSTNCGKSWIKLRYFTGDSIASAGFVNGRFTPTAADQWKLNRVQLDTNNLLPRKSNFPIAAVSPGANTLSIAGNYAAIFPIATTFTLTGSTDLNGNYVTSAAASFNGTRTVIPVTADIISSIADGSIIPNPKNNVLVRIRFMSSISANNFYIDDFGLPLTVGINNMVASNLKFQIFPNPAEKNTSISFNLIKTEKVKVNIYDVLGRNVKNINENVLDPGAHQFNVTLENKGIYFVKLQIGEELFTKKLIIN